MLLDIWKPSAIDKVLPACARSFNGMRYKARRFKFTDEVTASLARTRSRVSGATTRRRPAASTSGRSCRMSLGTGIALDARSGGPACDSTSAAMPRWDL